MTAKKEPVPASKPEAKQPTKVPDLSKEERNQRFFDSLKKLKAILDVVFRKEDIRNRLASVTNPEKIQTSTKLTARQVIFVADAFWLADQFPALYKPLREYGEHIGLTMLSKDGYGLDQSIKLVGAIEQSAAFKSMFGPVAEEKKKHRLPGFNKGETKQ